MKQLFGYSKWDNFKNVILKSRTTCELSGQDIVDHFADVGKKVSIGSGASKEIAFAQTYFAMQTRKAELKKQKSQKVESLETTLEVYDQLLKEVK